MVLVILFYALQITLLACAGIFMWTWFSGGPYTPIPHHIMESIVKKIDLQPGQVIYDLGAGDARVLIHACKKYKVTAIGYEINPIVLLVGKLKAALARCGTQVHLVLGDLYKAPLRNADVVFVHLLPHGMRRLSRKLLAELPAGARVVSYGAQIPDLTFVKTITVKKGKLTYPLTAHVYTR
ncbi:MAG TPA: hypothetical protein PKL83_06260 [bacterium]|nr:hypothetical protein [bacterium]